MRPNWVERICRRDMRHRGHEFFEWLFAELVACEKALLQQGYALIG
jgi:hypothetical protein